MTNQEIKNLLEPVGRPMFVGHPMLTVTRAQLEEIAEERCIPVTGANHNELIRRILANIKLQEGCLYL